MLKIFQNIKKEYLVVFLMSICVVFSGSLIAPIEQRFVSLLTPNNALMGFTFMIGTLSISVVSLVFARLSRMYGKNRFIILGAACGIIYPLIFATSTNILQYAGGKFVFGFAGAAMGPLLIAYLQEYLSDSRDQGKLLGYLYSAQSIAGSMGAIFGGYLADKYLLNTPFYAQFIILLIPFFIAVIFFNKEEKNKETSKNENYFFGIKYILSKPYLLYHLILEFPFKMNWGVKVILYPMIIFSFVDSSLIIGSVFASQGVVAMIVLLFAGTFVDRKSFLVGMKIAFLVLAFASLMMALSTDLYMFWIFAGLFAVGEAISGPAKGVLEIKNIENEHRAEVIATFCIFGFLFESLSPLLAGILLAFLAPQSVLLVYSLIIWLFFVLATIFLKLKLNIPKRV
jgi:MFS family permease